MKNSEYRILKDCISFLDYCLARVEGRVLRDKTVSASAETVLWSRRESNPRPNNEQIRFLHAYSDLYCRE